MPARHMLFVIILTGVSLLGCSQSEATPPLSPPDIDQVEGQAAPDNATRPDEVETIPTDVPSATLPQAEEDMADDLEVEPVAEEASDDVQEAAPAPAANAPDYGDPVYQTDFSSGWPEINTDTGNESMVDGGYQIDTRLAMWTFTTRMQLAEFYAVATAFSADCPPEGAFGVAVNYVNDEALRAFVVTCTNEWRLYEKNSPSVASTIAQGSIPFDVDTSTKTRVGVEVLETTYTFFINDVEVGAIELADSPIGDFGPYAQTSADGAPVSVIFTGLEVYEP